MNKKKKAVEAKHRKKPQAPQGPRQGSPRRRPRPDPHQKK